MTLQLFKKTLAFFSNMFAMRCASVLIITLTFADGVAQDYGSKYVAAKQLLEEGKYNLAMESFRSLMVYDQQNPYTQYASFFYALAAYRQGYKELAKNSWLQHRLLYPQWEQADEVTLWLAKIYFEEREYFQALKVLKELDSRRRNESQNLQRYYLGKVEDVETLRMMYEEHPANEVIGERLAKRIAQQPANLQDSSLLNSLIARFDLDADALQPPAPVVIKKEKYRVALLFPFLAKSLEPTPVLKPNQFILDLYQGMRYANDSLAKEGMQLELLSYDVERNPEVLRELLNARELQSADVLVGPLLGTEETRLVQEFSKRNGIYMINPVTSNSSYLGDNPFAMLAQPSHETIGAKTAEMVDRLLTNKNCFVLYGDAAKDSLMAAAFIGRARQLGVNVVHVERINRERTQGILPLLATATQYDEYNNPTEFKIKRDSLGSVFVASEDPVIYAKVISSIQFRNDSTKVFGLESWIAPENTTVNFDTFERVGVVMAAPNYTDESDKAYQQFRRNFIARTGQMPNLYSRIGYDFTFLLAHALREYGVYFLSGLQEAGFQEGVIHQGYNFNASRDNQYVPFITFREGSLHLLNPR